MMATALGQDLVVGSNSANVTTNITSGTNAFVNTYIGFTTNATNNRLNVLNPGTVLTNSADVFVGYAGSSNSLVISNGASVTDRIGFIGNDTISSNNSVLVTGTNSAWTNTGDLLVGYGGSSNSLVISSGGSVVNSNGYIGFTTSSNNLVTVTGTNSAWTNTGDLRVGYEGSSNSLVISDGGSVTNQSGFVGYTTNSSNNSVLVTGTNSAWTNTTYLFVGYNGSSNSLVISNRGSVVSSGGFIGNSTNSSNNIVTVSGTGSILTNTGELFIGNFGSSNSLVISNRASVINNSGLIGATADASNNIVVVTGSNSTWINTSSLFIGEAGSSNSLTINDGGSVTNQSGYIGNSTNSSNNSVLVTGAGSTWASSGSLSVGYQGISNSLVISNGASVKNSVGYIGFTTNSSNNSVLVTGAGSTWTNSGDLYVGDGGSSNSLVISNGGSVVNQFGYIGNTTNSSNNSVLVTGTGSTWTNSSQLSVGLSGSSNSLVISNGARVVNQLGVIGINALSSNNSVLVTGTNSSWSNASILYVGFQGSSNTLTVANGGSVSAANLTIASQAGSSGAVNIGSLGGSDTAGSLGTTPITFGDGTGVLNFNQTDTATLTQLISGSTGVNTVSQLGSGTTILSAANTYSGTTAISAGTLWAQNTQALGTSTVNLTGGSLQLGSYLEVDTMTWGGGQIYIPTLTSANGIYLNITNAATGLTATNSTNQFNVTGARLSLNVPTKLLSATNMTTNNFSTNSFTVTGLAKYNLSISNSVLWLTSLFSSYTIYAATPNQVQVASALNGFADATSGDRTTVTTALNSLTTDAQYQAAFEQMMPSIYSSLPTLAFNTANALNTKLFERIWLMQVAGLSGAAVAGDSPTQNNDNNPLGLKADQNWSPFVDANGIFASANSGGTLDTYNAQNGGVTTGGMYKFLPNLMAGAYAGYQYTHAGYDGSTSMEDNAARFGLLASWAGDTCYRNTDNIYLNGLLGGQMHNYNVDRQIVFSDINRTANATPTAGEFDSAVQVGYNFREGGFTFGPQASLQYTYLGVNSFDESGADSLDLNVDSFNSSSMMFTLGGQGAYRIEVDEDFAVIPMASASWQHECLQNPYGIQSAFATGGPSESFNFQSSAPLRDFFYGGVGVGFAIGQNWQVTVLWNASAANADLSSQNVYISAAARF